MRSTGLDLLRLIAVLLVLGRHLELAPQSHPLLLLWKRGGWVGVDLFFVLSGFLVSGLLFREYERRRTMDTVRFLIRRGFKIYPAFWCMLLVTMIIRYKTGLPSTTGVIGEVLFLQNYLDAIWNHTWSLAIEEHFYFAIAVIFALLARRIPDDPFRRFTWMFLGVAGLCQGLRVANLWIHPAGYTHWTHLFPTHLRVDSLFFGVWLAYLRHRLGHLPCRRVPGIVLILGGIACLSPAFMWTLEENLWVSVVGVTLFYLGGGLLVLAAARMEYAPCRLIRGLADVGAKSYSIYLWHMPVQMWLVPIIGTAIGSHLTLPSHVIYLAGTFLVGYPMSLLVEWPMLRLRDRLFPAHTTPPGAGGIS